MGFQTPISIRQALECIRKGEFVLPAIQRDYVWTEDHVTWLFDSLMRGYPISSFLFWSVKGENVKDYKFYNFLSDYRETFRIRGQEHPFHPEDRFTAILDGQQRLTSLYIGFMGSYAWRIGYGRKDYDNENSRPTRRLYLNISQNFDENEEEDGRIYNFSFLLDRDTQKQELYTDDDGQQWFLVGKILDLLDMTKFVSYIQGRSVLAISNLSKLATIVNAPLINFYLEEEEDLHKALNIFIRINRGAIQLSVSEIIMSIAISFWRKDAKQAFDKLIESVRQAGFTITNDFILKVFLFLFSKDIKFKATNFKKDTALLLEQNWDDLSACILETFRLIGKFGYQTDQSLPSFNVLVPVIYYLYHKKIWREFSTSIHYENDRAIICKWLHSAILLRIFGASSDTILARVKKAFTEDIAHPLSETITSFPVDEIKCNLKKEMAVSDEFLDELLHVQKDDRYAFPILALLYPHLDYKNNDFHKDHLHPCALIEAFNTSSMNENDSQYFREPTWWNSIMNLQMLDSHENQSKNDKALNVWLEQKDDSMKELWMRQSYIPANSSLELKDLKDFILKRRELLLAKLKEILA